VVSSSPRYSCNAQSLCTMWFDMTSFVVWSCLESSTSAAVRTAESITSHVTVELTPPPSNVLMQSGGGEGLFLLPKALQLLPTSPPALELNSFCTDAAITALARFTALQHLDLHGNAREVDWAQPVAQAVVPLLRTPRLLYCNYEPPAGHLMGGCYDSIERLPSSAASALMAASRLERLALQVHRWSNDILNVCEALPALRDLRWAA